jgi:diadenosine tetraphosphatase ApaH/serine/threonine PP2A family protein phosphatase
MGFPADSYLEDPDSVSDLEVVDILELISRVRPLVEEEPLLLKSDASSVYVVGDLHGNFEALKFVVDTWRQDPHALVVFLGDYVDRGDQQLETINYVLVLKLLYPEGVYLLRGNHETPQVNSYYGFSHVCGETFGERAKRMYNEYNILFSYLSVAFLVSREILLVHGGIPRGLPSLEYINTLEKGDLNAEDEILGQMLWNDPTQKYQEFVTNWKRGIHYEFGETVFSDFLERTGVKMVIRGHEVFPGGYKYFFGQRLLSIFSSPGNRGSCEAKMARIEDGTVSLLDITV